MGDENGRNRRGRGPKIKESITDTKVASHIKGWLTQEINNKTRKGRTHIRVPRGYELSHWRGFEAAKGFGYEFSSWQVNDLHKLQHRYDDQGRKNKTPEWYLDKIKLENQAKEKFRTENNIQFPRYQSVPKPGGVKLVIGEEIPKLLGSQQKVSSIYIMGSAIYVHFLDGTEASYVTSLLPEELTDLRRGVLSARKGVSISLEMGDDKFNCLLDGLSPESSLRDNLFKVDQLLGALTFGIDYFTGEKFNTKMPGFNNHLDVRTEMLTNNINHLDRLGYDKFSTILPHPTFEINPNFKLKLKQGNNIGFEGQELCITSRGVYVDWMDEVYYDDNFTIGIQMFPILQNFSSRYEQYKGYHPEIAKLAEYVRSVLLLSLDGKAGSTGESIYSTQMITGGISLTRCLHHSVLRHTVSLLQAQEGVLVKTSDPLIKASIAFFLAASWEATEMNIDTTILLYIFAFENLPDGNLKVSDILARLGKMFKKNSHVISDEVKKIMTEKMVKAGAGDIQIFEKLNGVAYEIALEHCQDIVLSNLYYDALPEDFSSDNIIITWFKASLENIQTNPLPLSVMKLFENWKLDPTYKKSDQLLSLMKKNNGKTRYPLFYSFLLYSKAVQLYENRMNNVKNENGLSLNIIESMRCLGECFDMLKIIDSGHDFILLVFHSFSTSHWIMSMDKQLFMAQNDLKASRSALSKAQYQEALYKAHSTKTFGESVLSALPADGHLVCKRACEVLSDIYSKMGNQSYAMEWSRIAEKEKIDFEKLNPAEKEKSQGVRSIPQPNTKSQPRHLRQSECCVIL